MNRGLNSKQEGKGKFHERREDCGKDGYSRSARRNHKHHSPPYSAITFYASEDSIRSR
jgi:hypothetical protein